MVIQNALSTLIFAALAAGTPVPAQTPFSNDSSVQLVVPFVHQQNDLNDQNSYIGYTTCGPASLTMALKYAGMSVGINEVLERIPYYVYIKGDQFYNLPEGAKYFGKSYKTIDISPKEFYETLKAGNPIILNIQNYDGILGHAVVVTGIRGFDGENAESLIVHDPFVGPYQTFKFKDQKTLIQPSGIINPIGHLKPFYVVNSTNQTLLTLNN